MWEGKVSESGVIRGSRPENVFPWGQPIFRKDYEGRVESVKLRVGQS